HSSEFLYRQPVEAKGVSGFLTPLKRGVSAGIFYDVHSVWKRRPLVCVSRRDAAREQRYIRESRAADNPAARAVRRFRLLWRGSGAGSCGTDPIVVHAGRAGPERDDGQTRRRAGYGALGRAAPVETANRPRRSGALLLRARREYQHARTARRPDGPAPAGDRHLPGRRSALVQQGESLVSGWQPDARRR